MKILSVDGKFKGSYGMKEEEKKIPRLVVFAFTNTTSIGSSGQWSTT